MSDEDKMKKALEEREQAEGATFDKPTNVPDAGTSLGKVTPKEQKNLDQKDAELKQKVDISDDLNVSVGYSVIPVDELLFKFVLLQVEKLNIGQQ